MPAKESAHVEKARRKLKQQLASEQNKINPAALEQMTNAIKTWISRHAEERIDLKQKDIKTVDGKYSLVKSKYVSRLLENLKNESKSSSKNKSASLEGRITHENTPTGQH